jgi:hypothetical protein
MRNGMKMNSNKMFKKAIFITAFLLFSIFSSQLVMAQGTVWEKLFMDPNGGQAWQAISSNTTRFVTIGYYGINWTSPEGLNWKAESKTNTTYFGLAYGNGRFVGVGFKGALITSTDGINWTTKSSGVTENIGSVVYAADKNWFVGVCGDGQVTISKDGGNTFTGYNNNTTFASIGYGDGLFVCSIGNGKVWTSTDAVNWTQRKAGDYHLFPTLYGNGTWVIAGKNGYIYSSSDGITWTQRKKVTGAYFLNGTWTGSYFVLSGEVLGSYAVMYTSPDGINWTSRLSYSKPWIACVHKKSNTPRVVAMGVWGSIVVSDAEADTLTITHPKYGSDLKARSSFTPGTTENITWTAGAGVSNVKIEFSSTGGGGTYSTVAASVPAAGGTYAWTVPDISSTDCVFRISDADNGAPVQHSAQFIIGSGEGGTLTVTAPNGGETLKQGSTYGIKWTSVDVSTKIRIRFSANNGTDWDIIGEGINNTGSWNWTVPNNVSTSYGLIRINAINVSGEPFDVSDGTFSINSTGNASVGVNVTSPNGGESLTGGKTHTVKWQSVGTVDHVDIHYSTDGGSNYTPVATGLSDSGSYNWTIPNTATSKGKILVRVFGEDSSSISDTSNSNFSVVLGNTGPPEIDLDRNKLIFGAIVNGSTPDPQVVTLTNAGGDSLNWSTTSSTSWLSVSPGSGSGDAELSVSVNQSGLSAGTYTGTITITDTNAVNSPQTISVTMNVLNAGQDQKPFGSFATPEDNATIRSSVPVTGWALDDVELESVKLYRVINGSDSYIGDAVFVEGSRPDVEAAYPTYPQNSRAGWGYMLLTNFLPDGVTVLKVIARDSTGYEVVLGTKTVTIDNANATQPFGAIDSPAQGGEASGSVYRNNGWALTPDPSTIPKDGSTIQVFIDGIFQGTANYNLYRSDIATAFPDYSNSQGAWAYMDLNTTGFKNGIHIIEWSVTDDNNNKDGIGSRFFAIKNLGARSAGSAVAAARPAPIRPTGLSRSHLNKNIQVIAKDYSTPIKFKTGYGKDSGKEMFASEDGKIHVVTKPMKRIVMNIDDNPQPGKFYTGYLKVGEELRRLPIGSTIDHANGIFYWQLGAGFISEYDLVFFVTENGVTRKKEVNIKVDIK